MSTLPTPTPIPAPASVPKASEIGEHLELAARGVVTLKGLDDARWEPLLIGVTQRGVVTPADKRAATALRKQLTAELKTARWS